MTNKNFEYIDKHIERIQNLKKEIRECDRLICLMKHKEVLSFNIEQLFTGCKRISQIDFKLNKPDKQFHTDIIKVFSEYKERLIAELNNVLNGIGCEPYQDEEVDE